MSLYKGIAPALALTLASLMLFSPQIGCGGGGGGSTANSTPTPSASSTPTPSLGRYTVTDVTPIGLTASNEYFVNQIASESGLIAGEVAPNGVNYRKLYLYDISTRSYEQIKWVGQNGFVTYEYGFVNGINNKGQVIGTINPYDATTEYYRFLYDHQTKTTTLFNNSLGLYVMKGINDNGDILNDDSKGSVSTWECSVYRYKSAGSYQKVILPVPSGASSCFGEFINNAGTVGGYVNNNSSGGKSFPFIWKDGQMTVLPMPDGATSFDLTQLTEDNVLTGRIQTADNKFVAAYWKDGDIHLFPTPSGASSAFSVRSNQHSELVANYASQSFLEIDGALVDLTTQVPSNLNMQIQGTQHVFDDGRILVGGHISGSTGTQFLLTPR